MDKTLGQIAFEAGCPGFDWVKSSKNIKAEWQRVAAAVAAAVKEEDARICEANEARWSGSASDWDRGNLKASQVLAIAIRASIKEVK